MLSKFDSKATKPSQFSAMTTNLPLSAPPHATLGVICAEMRLKAAPIANTVIQSPTTRHSIALSLRRIIGAYRTQCPHALAAEIGAQIRIGEGVGGGAGAVIGHHPGFELVVGALVVRLGGKQTANKINDAFGKDHPASLDDAIARLESYAPVRAGSCLTYPPESFETHVARWKAEAAAAARWLRTCRNVHFSDSGH